VEKELLVALIIISSSTTRAMGFPRETPKSNCLHNHNANITYVKWQVIFQSQCLEAIRVKGKKQNS